MDHASRRAWERGEPRAVGLLDRAVLRGEFRFSGARGSESRSVLAGVLLGALSSTDADFVGLKMPCFPGFSRIEARLLRHPVETQVSRNLEPSLFSRLF